MARGDDEDRARRTAEGEIERVQELVRLCEVSSPRRRTIAAENRDWYERGNNEGPRATVNRLRAHLDRVGSFVYAPDTARFGVRLPIAVREQWAPYAAVARDEFRSRWTDSGVDLLNMMQIEWALVYGATIQKVDADPASGFRGAYIEPWDFGVSREDVPQLDEQDTVTHKYMLSVPQIRRWVQGDPRATALLRIAEEHASVPMGSGGSGQRSGLVITGVSGTFPNATISGGFPGNTDIGADLIVPQVAEPCVVFVDCWERRLFRRRPLSGGKPDVFEDWWVTTMVADRGVIFARRRNPVLPWTRVSADRVLPGELPFIAYVPRPLPDYFWGRSELSDIRQLQLWFEDHLEDMRRGTKRQLDPAKFASGVTDVEEVQRALDSIGGFAASDQPNARLQTVQVQVSAEAFQMLNEIKAEFSESSGIPESISDPGTTPGGVRSTGQFSMVAGIGGGRIRRMALVIEDPLGQTATKGFHIMQRHDPQRYTLPDEQGEFLLSQLPAGITFHVDAHSAAPIFAEQTQAKAVLLQRTGSIGKDDFVELIDPPGREELKIKARIIAKNQAEVQKEMLQIQAEKARGRGGSRLPKTPK